MSEELQAVATLWPHLTFAAVFMLGFFWVERRKMRLAERQRDLFEAELERRSRVDRRRREQRARARRRRLAERSTVQLQGGGAALTRMRIEAVDGLLFEKPFAHPAVEVPEQREAGDES